MAIKLKQVCEAFRIPGVFQSYEGIKVLESPAGTGKTFRYDSPEYVKDIDTQKAAGPVAESLLTKIMHK